MQQINEHYVILDATASRRAMWRDKEDENTVYIDERREVKPDVICVWQHLPFKHGGFKLIDFDPPQMLYESKGKPSTFNLKEKYGKLNPETWQRDFHKAMLQFMQIVEPYGVIVVKWNNNHIPDDKMLACFPIQPRFGTQVKHSRGVRRRGSTEPRSTTSWFTFINTPEISSQ